MGCDIHLYVQIKNRYDKWEFLPAPKGLDEWWDEHCEKFSINEPNKWLFGRNYALFGMLAGVRRPDLTVFSQKGMPKDFEYTGCSISDHIQLKDDPEWGHSHSWLTLEEVIDKISVKSFNAIINTKVRKTKEPWRLCFKKEYYMQAQHFFGTLIPAIIKTSCYMDFDRIRLVFWFDS